MIYFINIGKFKQIWLNYFLHWTAFLQCFISKDGIVVIYERISYIHVYGFFQKCFGQEMWRAFQYIANYAPIFFYIYLEGLPNFPENTFRNMRRFEVYIYNKRRQTDFLKSRQKLYLLWWKCLILVFNSDKQSKF